MDLIFDMTNLVSLIEVLSKKKLISQVCGGVCVCGGCVGYLDCGWMFSEGSCMFLGGDCLKRNWARPVSVALISCRLVSQCLTILSVWPSAWGRGVSVVSDGVWVL